MKALQFGEYGDPEVLQVGEAAEPHAGPGQVRIAVRAVSVNPFDWKLRSGMMREMMPLDLPYIPGIDAAGVVDEVGEGTEGVSVGDQVFGFAVGSASARYAVLETFAAKPAQMSWEEAAGLPVAAETALRTLNLLGLTEGQTLLVNGAAGGVGAAAVQLARARGAEVIGTASESNHEYLRSLGATPTTYGDGLVQRVRAIAPNGVDLALDTAGSGALPDLIEITGSPDNVVTIADYTAQQHGVRLSGGQAGRAVEALPLAARLFEEGRFTLPTRTFALADAPEAHRISQAGHLRGKLVLLVD
jgi:NADPH:quinone reductase-like Zn-dependent oxidoreductase